ncbi:MAG: DNA polymerase III subunit gamma/tau [Acidimicrobiia bacterium]
MEYQALYRRYRPQTFDDVIGQSHVTGTLAREVAEGRVAHAYLFAGPRGTGKTTTARVLAKALNCENRGPDGAPCNTCGPCVAITEGSSLDVLELDAASHNSVEDIRDMRVSVTTVASVAGARRVFILDEAHMLSRAAGNALLKTLEEPPEHVHFVLATTEPYKLLDTVRSRSQRFDFHAVPVEALAAHLARVAEAEGIRADPAALVEVSRHALGSVRDSLSLLEQVSALGAGSVDVAGVRRALGMAGADATARLAGAIAEHDVASALELVAELASQGVDLRRFAGEAVGFFRGVFLAHYAPNLAEVTDEPPDVLRQWTEAAGRLPTSDVLRAVDVLGEALVKLREGREERLMLELALIRLTRPETSLDSGAMLTRLERLERRAPGGPAPATSPIPVPTAPVPAARVTPAAEQAPPPAPAPTAAPVPADEPAPATASAPADEPAPATAPAPAVQEPAPATVTAEQFVAVWPGLYGSLRDVLGARRWALFRETEPVGVEHGKLVIGVRHDFHLEALRQDAAVTSIVATRAGDLLGGSVGVMFRSIGEHPAASPEEAEPELEKEALFEAPDDLTDPFRLVASELGAELVEDDSDDR